MDLLLFGIQGSGKGTQAKRLAQKLGYQVFEAGAALRGIAASGTPLGNTVKSYIDAGHLVPHEIIMRVVRENIAAVPKTQPVLFDGIPRDRDQQHDFDVLMAELGREFRCVRLKLDEDEAMRRIQGRAVAEGRADDAREEVIRKRMGIYREKTSPVADAYAERGLLTDVDAAGDVDAVFDRLLSVVPVTA